MSRPFDFVQVRHELRTPINHILGYCEILLEEEDMPERFVTDLQKIHRGGKQLLELISRYLDEATFHTQHDWPQLQHELRTPVNHIIGYAELLIEFATEQDQSRLAADLRKIRTAAQQWLTLMETYLLGAPAAEPAAPSHVPAPAAPTGSKAEATPASPIVAAPTQPATLLVVEDDRPSRELLARRLHRAGFQVLTASDGQEGLDLIRSRPFDLVLVDCVMPGLDGLELVRLVRQQKSPTELPIIMVTGRDSSGDVVRALHLGANDYLTKPVDFDVALARLNTHLNWRRAQAEVTAKMNEIRRLADDLKVRNDFIKQILGRYVTDAVVENVLENPKGLELGGQRRTVSVLMSDLRGFTQLSEQLSPEQVVEVLNVYLGAMAEVIAQHHGVVDAFIGDAVIGVFGSPIIREDHPALAVACALAMQADMERVNRRLSRLGIAALEMGIGINTGEVVVGNIGSDKRAQYSVIGAQVNLTARIQGVSVGGEVLVSQTTAAAVAAHLKTERTFTISSKGVGAPIHIHSVMGLRGQDHLDLPQSNHFEAGLHKKLPVKYQRLTDDKSLFGQGTDAELVIVTSRSGFLKAIELLHARCDLKLILPPTPTGASSDLYCKVMDEQPGENGWFVRFTSPFVG